MASELGSNIGGGTRETVVLRLGDEDTVFGSNGKDTLTVEGRGDQDTVFGSLGVDILESESD